MTAIPLGPADAAATARLTAVAIDPGLLVRVSGFTSNEPYFAASGANRFDAPGSPAAPEFATCYFGTNLTVALAETVLHDDLPDAGFFRLARSRFVGKHVLRFAGERLMLADLTGPHLKRLGGHAALSGTGDYSVAQLWSLAVHRNPGNYDGFIFMSRHVNDQRAVVLFDRARAKVALASQCELLFDEDFAAAANELGILLP